MTDIYILTIGILIGTILGFILHEKIFPENKTVNEISQNFKKANIQNSDLNVKYNPETDKLEQVKPKRVLGFLWKKKIKTS